MKTGGNAKYADRADGACRVRPPADGGFELRVPIRNLAKCASYIIFFAIVCVATVPLSRAQGTLQFQTKSGTTVDARVYQSDGRTPVDGNYWGQLYAGPPGGQLSAVGVPVPFRSDAGIGYITFGGSVEVPGVAIGAQANVKLVVWSKALGNTYEEAIAQNRGATGESNVITVSTGGGTTPPPQLIGLHGFSLRPSITYQEWQFANTNRISIQDVSSALDYPSLITVSNLTGAVETVRIRLNQLKHNYPDDIDALLVAPNGKTVMVMSDAGGSQGLIGADLTFSDAAAADILDLGPITSGAWRPKNYEGFVDPMPTPAPSAPYGTTFANLAGGPAAGTWRLYVADDTPQDSGSLSGWELFITTLPPTNFPPTIASQPQGQTANPGASVTFSIIATGTAPLYYQWRKDGVDITGANSPTLVLDNITVSSAGTYTVWVNNLAGETTSAGAVLTVLSRPPSITTQPQGQTANLGDTVSFSVIASGSEPLFYQWRKDGLDITGANDKTLVLDNVTASHSGTYAVWVNNVAGETTSAGAVLTVLNRPRPPTSPSISEEWHFANTNRIIIRDNSSALDYPSLITVSNLPNVVETVRIKLNALEHNFPDDIDVLLVAPNGKAVMVMSDAGGGQPIVSANLMFSDAAATDIPDSNPLTSGTWRPKNYDGLLDAMPSPAPPAPHGATFANLAGEHADGTWKLYIVDDTLSDSGSLSGWELLLTTLVPTNLPPTIASQPQGQTANPGAKVTFSIIATGTAPLYYQWRKDGVDITGANSPTLMLDNITVSIAGTYTVWVNNVAGQTTSAEAVLTVLSLPPTITAQPQGQTANPGDTVSISVLASGTEPLFYQWRKDGVDITGANDKTLVLDKITESTAGTYTVWVNNVAGQTTSTEAVLTVSRPPTIAVQPESKTANPGDTVSFSVLAFGTEPLFYQWRKDGVDIAGANDKTLVLDNVTASNSGTYSVWVNNVAGQTTSAVAVLTIFSLPPTITAQPQGQTANPGDTVSFSVLASGTEPLFYQWRKDGLDIIGANDKTLVLNKITESTAGTYTVWVNNVAGQTTSTEAVLTVSRPPTIAVQPESKTANPGDTVSFAVVTSGTKPHFYQWRKDGVDIVGANSASLVIENITISSAGTYTVWVNNLVGDTTSAGAVLAVNSPPVIAAQPESQTASPGESVVFAVAALGTPPLAYQWLKNGIDIEGATGASLVLTNVTSSEASSYSVRVSNVAGVRTSAGAILNVRIILSFQQLNYNVAENAGTIRIAVRKQGTGVATVNYSTGGGTAEIGRDYRSANGNLRFGVNEKEQQISIELLDDYVLDGSKSIQLRLVAPSENAALGEFPTAILTIQDNDAAIADQGFLKLIFPESRPVLNASLQVLLDPDRLGGWRFSWETLWRPSLDTAMRLEPGNYDLEFRPVAGFLAPGKAAVSLLAGPTTRRLFHYVSNTTSRAGSLSVNIEPLDQLRDRQLFPGWKIQGEEAYRESNTSAMDLPAGPHIVTFKDVDGWIAPSPRVVTVLSDVENAITAAYLVAPPLPSGSSQPQVLRSYQAIRDGLGSSPILPYSLCGELRTSVGYGSGIAVRERVVLTAAHVLFDEGTTNFVSEVEWFHERHAGEYDPKPLRAQGWYVFTNYLDARRLERASGLKPGQSGPASRQWDVAAVYFAEAVARGGQSGYLLSTNEVNDWLFSSELKTLIGYPLNGSERDHRMHTLLPGNYGFLPPSLAAPSVYPSTEFSSVGGNSGGPFCVNHRQSDGFQAFFPAAVYLGSDGTRSLVRAIDRDVATLINRAASSAELGTNFGGGGVIRFPLVKDGSDLLAFQRLTVQLEPAEALLLGGAWRVTNFVTMTFTNAAKATAELTAGVEYVLEFKPIAGYITPDPFSVTLVDGQDANRTFAYKRVEAPVLRALPGAGIFVSGPAGARVVIEYRSTFAEGSRWTQVETNTLTDQPRRILGSPWPANAVGFYRARREE